MILLVDSGATNSNWKFLTETDSHTYTREGINLSTSHLQHIELKFSSELQSQVRKIFFFGAGTGDPNKESQLKKILTASFPKTQSISVGSDLETAALALTNGERCVISILGTGSNCAIFEDNKVARKLNNLGFILGDEGSGFRMGREVIRHFFYQLMTKDDAELFTSTFPISRAELIREVYHSSQPANTYIASYCKFLSQSSLELRKSVVGKHLSEFFTLQIGQFEEANNLRLHFSGSIAWHFQEELKEICIKYGYKLGNIIQNPIDSLSYTKLADL